MEGAPKQVFNTPEEEIAYLREQIALRERVASAAPEQFPAVAQETLREYAAAPKTVLPEERQMSDMHLTEVAVRGGTPEAKITEVLSIVHEHGIKNALTLLDKIGDAHITDEVHRRLIEEIREGSTIKDLKEGVPPWKVLHMSLFSVALPDQGGDTQADFKTLIAMMEQFYAGMQAVSFDGKPAHYTLEIAVAEASDEIVFYAAVPTGSVDLFEKQILSLFPHARVALEPHDYNIFATGGVALTSVAKLKKHPIYPIKMHDGFNADPLNVLLNAFSKIEREGGGAALQLVIQTGGGKYQHTYEGIIKRVRDGEKPSVAINKSTLGGGLLESAKSTFFTSTKKKDTPEPPKEVDSDAVEVFTQKVATPITGVNIRLAVSATSEARASQILSEIEAGFHQFENTKANSVQFERQKGSAAKKALKAFSFREFATESVLPLSFGELATLLHVPSEGIESSPQFKQSRAKTAPAPIDLPQEGTLLGINSFRNVETNVYATAEDRLRHFYIIGQTGTGKTTLMKNMIIQDIEEGNGVCMIDPHGTDIADILSAVPDSRRDDVIYFDPARTDMVMGLNMLEYDSDKPEQKTFVVNELFSIFQKLYGANPESMGPMFEQYFRNATQLVMEDPESGNTLLDISRVFADKEYRDYKISKARNPVVVQFWTDIATKAGGEASLENIVPYITSKFDVFTANDYMRPIIGQQKSAFNFRKIMDEKKILLVNLSKGRLGEINANLIGMIIVGKILMAALSRVDDVTRGYPPFYLHMDEFQNVTTDSISAILSEARKYKLGLTVAHQFLAQIDEKIRDAVFGNVGSMAVFRVGPEDAQFLEHQFSPVFASNDLMNIENHNAYMRLLARGVPTKPFSMRTIAPPTVDPTRVEDLIQYSYGRYGQPRRKVEMEITARYAK